MIGSKYNEPEIIHLLGKPSIFNLEILDGLMANPVVLFRRKTTGGISFLMALFYPG